ncbi:hypothetical protein [Streptococcus suis]|nr:hypothetical protein [Streptococcus suis]
MSHHHVLQNGSDIRGIAIATDEYAVNLTPQATHVECVVLLQRSNG